MILDNEKYKKVRVAQSQGARTVKDVKEMTDIVIEDDDEYRKIDRVLQNVCKCQNISVNEVVEAVKNGADTLEKVMDETKAGTGCARC
ncbi:(2Fe-2S)-binding protein, partial [Terrisporobacter sp.]|uniref:(2Fe-2S)-binding protein n=1 Tax=Terrisporobacter sp. TaxID=1965305 RepID=UPI00261AD3EA